MVHHTQTQGDAFPWATRMPVTALTLDFCGVPGATVPNASLALIRAHGWPAGRRLGVGCVDGRSVWAEDEGELRAHTARSYMIAPLVCLLRC